MSGDFVQRGEPAVYSKYLRTRMALSCGADLVVELPSAFAVSSAEDFAACGVALLTGLGAVDVLCFGSEDGDIRRIRTAAGILAKEGGDFSSLLSIGLRSGLSWPQALCQACLRWTKIRIFSEEKKWTNSWAPPTISWESRVLQGHPAPEQSAYSVHHPPPGTGIPRQWAGGRTGFSLSHPADT